MCVCVCSLGFFLCKIVSSSETQVLPFLPSCLYTLWFFYYNYSVSLDRTSRTMLCRCGRNKHFYLFLDIKESFHFSLLCMILTVSFSLVDSTMLKKFPCSPCLLNTLYYQSVLVLVFGFCGLIFSCPVSSCFSNHMIHHIGWLTHVTFCIPRRSSYHSWRLLRVAGFWVLVF